MPALLSKAADKLQKQMPTINMEEPLSGPEDSKMAPETQRLREFLEVDYVRPVGVTNLQEWSTHKAEQGKHRNKTFGEIFQLAMVMARKATLTSAWALSFKGYSQARLKKMAQQQLQKAVPNETSDLDDWKVCQHPEKSGTMGKTAGPMNKPPEAKEASGSTVRASSKRRSLPTSSTRMPVDLDRDQLRTRKAAVARGRAVPAGPGDLVSDRGKSPDGRGKGHSDFEESQDSAFVASLCTQIEQSILNIEQQLNHEARSPHEVANKYRMPSLDVLEITQIGAGMIGQVLREHGQRAVTLQQERDTITDFKKVAENRTVSMYEPEHIWFSLTRPWKQRQGKKLVPFWPEDLIRELFYYQIERGRHLHLTGEPDMFGHMSCHLAEVQRGMLCLVHNPADLGRKTVPSGNNHLNKKTVVFTTSRALQQALDTRITAGTKNEQAQQPITKHDTHIQHRSRHHPRCNRFADKVALCLQRETGTPLPVEELLVGEHKREGSDSDLTVAKQALKRRRLRGKQPPQPQVPPKVEDPWVKVFQMVNDRIPPKGRVYLQEGDEVVTQVQALIPSMLSSKSFSAEESITSNQH